MLWENLREEEIKQAAEISGGVCVMPMGCLEMHGQHLPLNTDNLIAEATALGAAKKEPVCIFPTFKLGDIQGLTSHYGSVILSVELQQAMLEEMCAEIARNGFKKILILNAHGGNPSMLHNFIRSTKNKRKDYVVLCRNAYDYGIYDLMRDIDNGVEFPILNDEDIGTLRDFTTNRKTIGHACLEETSLILEIAPELVRMDRMHVVDGLSTHKADYLAEYGMTASTRFFSVNYPNSYCAAHPDKASARIGRVLLDKYIERQAEAVRRLKADDKVLEWLDEYNGLRIE